MTATAQYFTPVENALGIPGSNVVSASSTPAVTPGKIVRMKDVTGTYGEIEAIYLACLSGQKAGNLVTYKLETSGQAKAANVVVALSVASANKNYPLAVALAANATGANNYGWFAIQGTVSVLKTASVVTGNVAVYMSATAGRITPTAASGKQVTNARTMNQASVATTTSSVLVYIDRPFMQGQKV